MILMFEKKSFIASIHRPSNGLADGNLPNRNYAELTGN